MKSNYNQLRKITMTALMIALNKLVCFEIKMIFGVGVIVVW